MFPQTESKMDNKYVKNRTELIQRNMVCKFFSPLKYDVELKTRKINLYLIIKYTRVPWFGFSIFSF
jgi:hypothetical protein